MKKKPLLLWYLFIHSELWIVLFFSNVLCPFKFFKARRAPHGPGQIHKVTKNPNGPFPTCLGSPNFHLPLLWTVSGKCDKEKKPPWRAPHGPKVHTAALDRSASQPDSFLKTLWYDSIFWKEYILYLMSARASSPIWFSPLTLPHWRGSFLCFFFQYFQS